MKKPFISYCIPCLGEVKHLFEQKDLEIKQIVPSLEMQPDLCWNAACLLFFLEGLALVNRCFSAVFMIDHIHNLPTEDFREIYVSHQWMHFHVRKEGIIAVKISCDQ